MNPKLFLKIINEILDKHAPLKNVSNKEYKRMFKPWISKSILKQINKRDYFFRKYLNEKDAKKKESFRNEFKKLRNNIVYNIKSNKEQYYQNYFHDNCKNMKNIWLGIKSLISNKPTKIDYPTCILDEQNNILTETKQIANSFNNYFVNISKNILSKIRFSGNKSYKDFLKNKNCDTIYISAVNENEIITGITSCFIS